MKIGYARISTKDQKLDLQKDALIRAGCEEIFSDVASGAKTARSGLEKAIEFARRGDMLVVWKLDRLGRSLRHLITIVNDLHERGIGFESIEEKLDTTTAGGKLFFHIFGALAEFERELIRERTNAGLKAARARGRNGGRPPALSEEDLPMVKKLLNNREIPIKDICTKFEISRATLYKYFPQNKS